MVLPVEFGGQLRAVFVAVVAAWSLACSGMVDLSSYEAQITEPWSAMTLPLDGGTVNSSDMGSIIVSYDADRHPPKETAQEWLRALKEAGYEGAPVEHIEGYGFMCLVKRSDGQVQQLAVLEVMGNVVVNIANVDLPEEDVTADEGGG